MAVELTGQSSVPSSAALTAYFARSASRSTGPQLVVDPTRPFLSQGVPTGASRSPICHFNLKSLLISPRLIHVRSH